MKSKEELTNALEEYYKHGIKLADNLTKTAELHRKMIDNLYLLMQGLIKDGKLTQAEQRLTAVIKIIEQVEVDSIASHIQDKLLNVIEWEDVFD